MTDLLPDLSFLQSSIQEGSVDKCIQICHIMATCHSLRTVDEELLGDPLDVKMFQFTGWSYVEGGGHVPEQSGSNLEAVVQSIARPPSSASQFIDQQGTHSCVSVLSCMGDYDSPELTFMAGINRTGRSAQLRVYFGASSFECGCKTIWG